MSRLIASACSRTRSRAVMKRLCLVVISLTLLFLLGACGSGASISASSSKTVTQAAKLALGTINLEGTEREVSADSASRLLPLWQLWSDLNTSSTAAPEELAAVVDAIQSAMSTDQLGAIEAMEFSQSEIDAAAQGAAAPAAAGDAAAGAGAQAAQVAMAPEMGGDMNAGMPPDAGIPGGGDSSQVQANAPQAGGFGSSGPFRRVIALLQSKLPG